MIDVQGDNEPTSSVTVVVIRYLSDQPRGTEQLLLKATGSTEELIRSFVQPQDQRTWDTSSKTNSRRWWAVVDDSLQSSFNRSSHYSIQHNVVICSASRPCFAYAPHVHHLRSSAPHHLKRSPLLHLHLILSQHFEPWAQKSNHGPAPWSNLTVITVPKPT